METYEKLDDSTIKVSKSETKEIEHTYDYSFLKEQLVRIQEQKAREIEQRDAEIAEVEALIAEADKLGISESVDNTPQEETKDKV